MNNAAQQEWAIKTVTKTMTKKCASWRKHDSYPEDQILAMETFLESLTPPTVETASMQEDHEGNKE